jgi:hypothetical protein
MEVKKRGILLIQLHAKDEFSYGSSILDEVKSIDENIALYDVDNYSESFVIQMAEKFLEALDESLMVILENDEKLELNGITRLLANLTKSAKKPNETLYMGKNESVLRFSHWLSIQQVSNESELKAKLTIWVTEQ